MVQGAAVAIAVACVAALLYGVFGSHFSLTAAKERPPYRMHGGDEVLVIDSDTLNISKRIPVKGIPWGIVTYPKAIGSLDQVIKSHSHSGHTHN